MIRKVFTGCAILACLSCLVLAPVSVAASTTLTVWSQTEHNEILRTLVGEFEEEHGVKVEFIDIHPLGQREKLILDGPAGKGPDIVSVPHDGLGLMVLQGTISPVEYPDEVLDQFMPVAIEALYYDGKLWGLPFAYNSVALMYNKDLLPEVPATFEELISVAKEMTHDGQYGLLWDLTNVYFDWPIFGGKGAYIFGFDDGFDVQDVGLANKGAVEALNILADMRKSGMNPEGTDYMVSNSLFMEGKVAAVIDGAWALTGFRQAGVNYGVAKIPPYADGSELAPLVSVSTYAVSAFSKNKELAAELIKFLTSHEVLLAIYQGTADLPPRKDVISHPAVATHPDASALAEQAAAGMPTPNVPEMNAVWQPFTDAVIAVLTGQADAESALEMSVEMIHEAIAEMHRGADL